ncbi:MAG: hypothetical protein V1861_02270 [Candidatus Micrarchaeota archaeon]
MAGPVPISEEGQIPQALINARAVEASLPQARTDLPRVPDTDLQRLLEFAQQGNQRRFTETLTQVAPATNPTATYTQISEVVNYWREVAVHTARYILANATGDTRTADQEMEELNRLRRIGQARNYVNTGTSILSGVDNGIVDYGRAHNVPPEQIDQQRRDAAKAAMEHGFSIGEVLNVFGDLAGVGGDSTTNTASAQQFQELLREAAVTHSENMRNSMRDLQDRINSTTDLSKKRQLEDEYRQLLQEYNRLIGGAMGSDADKFAKGEEPTERAPGGRTITINEDEMEQRARDQATLIIREHMHRPGEYVPVKVNRLA